MDLELVFVYLIHCSIRKDFWHLIDALAAIVVPVDVQDDDGFDWITIVHFSVSVAV